MSFGLLALVVAAGLVGPLLASLHHYGPPIIVGEIAAGVVIGTSGFGWVDPADPLLAGLAAIGFALLMFIVGSCPRCGCRGPAGSIRRAASSCHSRRPASDEFWRSCATGSAGTRQIRPGCARRDRVDSDRRCRHRSGLARRTRHRSCRTCGHRRSTRGARWWNHARSCRGCTRSVVGAQAESTLSRSWMGT